MPHHPASAWAPVSPGSLSLSLSLSLSHRTHRTHTTHHHWHHHYQKRNKTHKRLSTRAATTPCGRRTGQSVSRTAVDSRRHSAPTPRHHTATEPRALPAAANDAPHRSLRSPAVDHTATEAHAPPAAARGLYRPGTVAAARLLAPAFRRRPGVGAGASARTATERARRHTIIAVSVIHSLVHYFSFLRSFI